MKRSMIWGATIVILLAALALAEGLPKPATAATSQPAASTQPARSLVDIQWDIAYTWEQIDSLMNNPDWKYADLARLMAKLRPLYQEQSQRMAQIRAKLHARLAENVEKMKAAREKLDQMPILTPEEEVRYQAWIKEGDKPK